MELKTNFSDIQFKNDGRLKLLIIVGTRPEIIRLAAVINKCRVYFDCLLAHTGQNYDYNLNGVFFKDLNVADPDVYLDAVGEDLGSTMGNIINSSYKLMTHTKPDAVLVLGDTNSCLSVIGAKDCTFLYFIWRQEIDVLMNVCLKRLIVVLLMLYLTLTFAIQKMLVVI